MLMSAVTLHLIANAYLHELQREAQTERLLRQARQATYLEACCGACCDDGGRPRAPRYA